MRKPSTANSDITTAAFISKLCHYQLHHIMTHLIAIFHPVLCLSAWLQEEHKKTKNSSPAILQSYLDDLWCAGLTQVTPEK